MIVLLLAHIPLVNNPIPNIEVDCSYGTGRRYCIHKITLKISIEKCMGLLFYFAFTGSDYTSSFFNTSKAAWWKLWLNSSFVDETFKKLSWKPFQLDEHDFEVVERFVCVAYDTPKKFHLQDKNKLHFMLFSQLSDNNLRRLPPTTDALEVGVFHEIMCDYLKLLK